MLAWYRSTQLILELQVELLPWLQELFLDSAELALPISLCPSRPHHRRCHRNFYYQIRLRRLVLVYQVYRLDLKQDPLYQVRRRRGHHYHLFEIDWQIRQSHHHHRQHMLIR